jgi:hypothetical protein
MHHQIILWANDAIVKLVRASVLLDNQRRVDKTIASFPADESSISRASNRTIFILSLTLLHLLLYSNPFT